MISKNIEAAAVLPALWSFGEASFDELKWELRVRDVTVDMEPRPLDILMCLLQHPGETLTRDELQLAVWGHSHLSENALSNAIAKLRKALGDETQSIIVTVYRVGYRLTAPVTRKEFPPRAAVTPAFSVGDPVPGRESWTLLRPVVPATNSEVWVAQHAETSEQRVFKFSCDGLQLPLLKREASLSRLMQSLAGGRSDIVRVLDWSFTEAPFFIECEYGGTGVPEWADSHGGLSTLSLRERIRLAAQVAEAVAAAHSIGVLHQDLKPANILIDKNQSGDWLIRLTGFGSGGFAAAAPLAEIGTLRTEFAQFPADNSNLRSAPPFYLAPELLQGHVPTVQSDIYALGVILYQFAAGDLRKPMAPQWERDITDELLRQDISDAASGNPAHRLSSAKELSNRLNALEARHIDRRTAVAAESVQQAAREALDRSRARRPWLTALVLSVSLGLLVSLWFFRVSSIARDEALRQFDISQAVNDFLNNDLIATANPDIGGSTNISMLEAVGKAADKIDSRFGKSPQVALALHQTVGNTYRTLGEYAAAEVEFRDAKAIAESLLGAESEVAVGNDLLLAQVLAYENRYKDAQALLDHAETMVRRQSLSDPMINVRLWDVRATLDRHRTDLLAAASDSEHTLESLDNLKLSHPGIYDSNAQSIVLIQLHAAQDYQDSGHRREAEILERSLVDDLTSQRGLADPLTIRARQQLVDNLMRLGRIDEAGSMLPSLIRDSSVSLGGMNRMSLAILRTQALVYEGQGLWQEALAASSRAENGFRQLFGSLNDSTVRSMMDSARIAAESGLGVQAISKYQDAHAAAIELQGENGLLTQLVDYDLVDAYLNIGHPDQARPLLNSLNLESLQSASPGISWTSRLSYQNGLLEMQSGKPETASKSFESALQSAGVDLHLRSEILSAANRLR